MADEFDLKPTSRGEEFLDVILRSLGCDTPDIPQPAWRYEEYLAAIANAIQNGGGGGGSGGGVLVVNMAYDEQKKNYYTDKTWKEIYDAPMAVIVVASNSMKGIGPVTQAKHQNGEYSVSYYVLSPMGEIIVSNLVTDSENGYLTHAE